MAQEIQRRDLKPRGHSFLGQNLAVNVAVAGLTTIFEANDIIDLVRICHSFNVSAANALDAFEIQAKFHQNDTYHALYNTSGAFTSPVGLIVAASGNLTAQLAASTGWYIMETRGLYAVRVQASAAVGIAVVDNFVCGG